MIKLSSERSSLRLACLARTAPATHCASFASPDAHTPRRWNNPSENRYTAQVRYANQSLQFDWLLSGDDDTIFLVDSAPARRA